jgi:hypothetical protein
MRSDSMSVSGTFVSYDRVVSEILQAVQQRDVKKPGKRQ